jgi:hypothetical protein
MGDPRNDNAETSTGALKPKGGAGSGAVPARAARYFEDLPPAVQSAQRTRRKAEIEAIGRLGFPVRGEFAGRPVQILGPVDRFSPYKEQARGPEDPFQLMVQRENGDRFITFASCLTFDGRRLVTPLLPLKNPPNPFDAALSGSRNRIAFMRNAVGRSFSNKSGSIRFSA